MQALVFCLFVLAASFATPASAIETITVPADAEVIELTTRGTLFENRGDRLQVETAAGLDGMTGRMSVRARTPGTNPNWVVFALSNPTNAVMERWLTADRYTMVGSGVVWPDLDSRRLEGVTPSIGFVPERIESDRADVFRLTLEPGQTVTYAVELTSDRFARVFLWKPLGYELKIRERQLFNGALIGIIGLLAVFLTAIFAANHAAIFPAAALVAWCILGYLCIDFGLFHRLFNLRPEDNAVYRAGAEAAMAASLVIFLHTFLRLASSHGMIRMLIGVWVLAQLALVAVAVVDPRLAATFARLSFVLISAVGTLTILFLVLAGRDLRALAIIPSWLLFLVWVFAATVALTGRLAGDVVVGGLVGGLVMIAVLIGFTVTQFAFRAPDPVHGVDPGEQKTRSLAVDAAGAATWEWIAKRDEIKVSPLVENALGLSEGQLCAKVDGFVGHVHPGDRDRFRQTLATIKDRSARRIKLEFRVQHADNSYRWLELEASSIDSVDGRNLRCVGLLRDVTDTQMAQERLLNDAVRCSLTGVPNRELLLDRLGVAMRRAEVADAAKPAVISIDIDRFKNINAALGYHVGDTLLLTLIRRLSNCISEDDTLARMQGDQFAVLVMSEQDPRALNDMAENMRRSLRSPVRIAGKEVVLTGSIGIAVHAGHANKLDLMRDAEIAMYRAKRQGADRVEVFHADMREEPDDRMVVETELRGALQNGQIKVYFQPLVYLPNLTLAGFEALVRWEHPQRGLLSPAAFVPYAEESGLIEELGRYVLRTGVKAVAQWQKQVKRIDRPLFVSVNVSTRELLTPDIVNEVRQTIERKLLPDGSLKLEITESVLMENPEAAIETLKSLRAAGIDIAIDDFGTGYSSLAYFKRLPCDTIKIDRLFMADSDGAVEGDGPAIVRSIVALAHELGKTVIAEGIENENEVSFLREIGCEYAQGYYYGEPMPAAEVTQLLKIVRRTERNDEASSLFRRRRKSKPKEITADKKPLLVDAKDIAVGEGFVPSATGRGSGKGNGNGTATVPGIEASRDSEAVRESEPIAVPPNGVTQPAIAARVSGMAANGSGVFQSQTARLPDAVVQPSMSEASVPEAAAVQAASRDEAVRGTGRVDGRANGSSHYGEARGSNSDSDFIPPADDPSFANAAVFGDMADGQIATQGGIDRPGYGNRAMAFSTQPPSFGARDGVTAYAGNGQANGSNGHVDGRRIANGGGDEHSGGLNGLGDGHGTSNGDGAAALANSAILPPVASTAPEMAVMGRAPASPRPGGLPQLSKEKSSAVVSTGSDGVLREAHGQVPATGATEGMPPPPLPPQNSSASGPPGSPVLGLSKLAAGTPLPGDGPGGHAAADNSNVSEAEKLRHSHGQNGGRQQDPNLARTAVSSEPDLAPPKLPGQNPPPSLAASTPGAAQGPPQLGAPPSLSKLPPGIATSLARLAGSLDEQNSRDGQKGPAADKG
ncbi:MAG: EAL domain-containing protein [Pseudomonadota bacterium]